MNLIIGNSQSDPIKSFFYLIRLALFFDNGTCSVFSTVVILETHANSFDMNGFTREAISIVGFPEHVF